MTAARAILVDLDGTLANTAAANYGAYAAALTEIGVSILQEDFENVAHGRNWRQFLPELLSKAGTPHDPAAIAKRKGELYAGMMGQIVLNRALLRLLEAQKRYCRLALVTTASASNVHCILSHFELTALFDTVVTGNDVVLHKPDPEAYRLAAARLGVTPVDCVVIEDSEIGVAAGEAFGAEVLRVHAPRDPALRRGAQAPRLR